MMMEKWMLTSYIHHLLGNTMEHHITSERVVDRGPLCSALHPSRSSAAVQTSCAVRCTPLRTPRSQQLLGLPGFLLQSGTDVAPASSSTDTCRASFAGAPSGRCLTCPKSASFLSPMTAQKSAHMSGRPVFSATDEFVTKSDHQIPKRRRSHCM